MRSVSCIQRNQKLGASSTSYLALTKSSHTTNASPALTLCTWGKCLNIAKTGGVGCFDIKWTKYECQKEANIFSQSQKNVFAIYVKLHKIVVNMNMKYKNKKESELIEANITH